MNLEYNLSVYCFTFDFECLFKTSCASIFRSVSSKFWSVIPHNFDPFPLFHKLLKSQFFSNKFNIKIVHKQFVLKSILIEIKTAIYVF